MALTDSEKIQVRKFAGYPAFGGVPSPNYGFRFFGIYGDLEFRMENLAPDEADEIVNNFLPKLLMLEADIFGVRENSDTSRAAVWYRNKSELKERIQNYREWRIWLCDFLGCEYGPRLQNKDTIRIVV